MQTTVKIQVTDEDILEGVPKSGRWCAVARAAKRAGVPVLEVTNTGIYTPAGSVYVLSREVTDWIDRFDLGQLVEPFEFETGKLFAADARLEETP
jgi:hypothetical protein